MESLLSPLFWAGVVKIIFVDLLLSGDNALVIALACRNLEGSRRLWGMTLGAGAAVIVRFIVTAVISTLMTMPYLKLAGSLALMWVAVNLFTQSDDEAEQDAGTSIWHAVRLVVIADMVMSIDNMIAVAAAAGGNAEMIWFGLAVSIPFLVMGAAAIAFVLNKVPVLVPIGACFLGYLAGSMIVTDPVWADRHISEIGMGIVFAGAVFLIGGGRKWFAETAG